MVYVSVRCPECNHDIEVELPKNKSLIVCKCDKCGKNLYEDGECITVCACPE